MAIDPAIFVNGVGFKKFFLNYKGVPSGEGLYDENKMCFYQGLSDETR
ncbi:hypothetical protein HanRHA438_Chr10g0465191 [Helianthus annuus]|nr:hypothetical protein HanRHA438_Chr10g0465191 [Helianthus annuus]